MILSHRGFWKTPKEKNKPVAFERSFSLGFGTETDIRDYCGELVISHDIPDSKSLPLKAFFSLYSKFSKELPLALNIKSDGLQKKLLEQLNYFEITNYFVFDMSVPDTIVYNQFEMRTYSRQSEYENSPSLYNQAIGIWMDEFEENWISKSIIENHIFNNKQVCIVSPELHGKEFLKRWGKYKEITNIYVDKKVHLCTDEPVTAKDFFNGTKD